MASKDQVASALVDWINACPIDPKISGLAELQDGFTISKLLLDIDPYYFKTAAANSDSASNPGTHWVVKFHKLKRLHKDLSKYYTDTLNHRLPQSSPNLTAIAKDGNVEETTKLVKIIVAAAVQSDKKEDYIGVMQALSASSQTALMGVINEMIELDETEEEEPTEEEKERKRTSDDMDQFRMEEEMARLVAEKEAAESNYKSLERRYRDLQSEMDSSQSHLTSLQDQLSGNRGSMDYSSHDPMLRAQLDEAQSDVQKLEDVIAEKEHAINANERTINSLNRRVEDLVPKADLGMKYKDDLDEANHTIEKLRKSQNVAEKYRKKLEGFSELERQYKLLEEQNAQMARDLAAGVDSSKQIPGLKRTIDQYKRQIERLENDGQEASRIRHALELERNMLKEQVDGTEVSRTKDHDLIQTLQDKIRELEIGVQSKAVNEISGDLDSELTYTTKTKTDLKLQIGRLENEIAHLKEGGGVGADNVMLQHMLDDATKAREKLEQDFLQAHTEKLVLESQLNSIRSGSTSEGSQVMLKLRSNLLDTEKALADVKIKHSEVLADMDLMKRELVTLKSDLSMVDKDKLEALSDLKAEANSDLAELQQKHAELEKAHRDVEFELEQKKTLLNTVLLEKDELSKKLSGQLDQMLEKEQVLSELKTTVAAFEGSADGRDAALEKRVAELQRKLDSGRDRSVKTNQHIKKQNGIIKELKERLEQAISADSDDKMKAKEEQLAELQRQKREELEILERENALILSAWHDQASRLQMNSVVLLRRSDAPSSWLNKQRNAVSSVR